MVDNSLYDINTVMIDKALLSIHYNNFRYACIYVFMKLFCHGTQGQFLSKVQLVWIQNFHSPRLAALLRLKNPLSYYLAIAGNGNGFMTKMKLLCPGFELKLLILFPTMMTVTFLFMYITITQWKWFIIAKYFIKAIYWK